MKIFFTLFIFAFCVHAKAQISITSTGTPFTQNFDGMGSAGTATLPTGFKIGTDWNAGTTATTLAAGTTGTGALTGTSSGGAYNFANGVTASSTDRALGFLSSGGYTSPRSIVLKLTNNTGTNISDLNISFDYEKYRTGTRAYNLTFFHGTTSNPTTSNTSGDQSYIADGANAVVNPPTTISKSFSITGLSVPNGNDYYLMWTYTGVGGSSNAQGLGIDNFSVTATGSGGDITPPSVTSLTPANNAINVTTSTTNLIMNFNENIALGTGDIVIKRFTDNSVFETINVSTATINNSTATIPFTNPLQAGIQYYVEVAAGTFEDIAGNDFAGITGNSTWNFTTIPLPAAGIVGNNYSFTSCASTFITEGWRQFSVTGPQTWTCTASGRTGADGIEMNAFVSGGNNPLNEDWLISPPFDLTSTTAPTLKFYSKGDFTPGNGLVVKVSTNYTPGTNPNTASWTDILTFPTPSGSNTAWVLNDNIDLSTYNSFNVYIAWHYNNPSTANSSRWRLDDVTLYSGIILPPCDEPTDQPTNLTLTPTATTVSGSFTAIAPPPSGYLIIRSTSSTLSATPADGITYTVGNALGGGTVIANGNSTSFIDNGLTPTTQYYYFVFAYNNENCTGGANYNVAINTPNGNTNNTTTLALAPCVEPLAAPTNLNLTVTNTSISGTFTPSASANRYLVVISTTTPLGATPSDGTPYAAGSAFGTGNVVSYSTTTTFNATSLTPNTPYFIFVFAANGDCTGEPDYLTTSLDGTINTTSGTGVPAGYYDAATGLTCQPLKTALRNIISTNTQVLSYTPGLWNLYHFSDKRRNDANTADILWDTYTDIPSGPEVYTFTIGANQCGSYVNEGDCYNREHSTPQSWFNQLSPMVSDAHHIFPTDGKINALHSSFPYGEVQTLVNPSSFNPSTNGSKLGTSPSENFGYTGTVFEPIDEYKGDYARAFLYMAVRYEDEIIAQNWSANGSANSALLSPADSNDVVFRKHQIYDNWFIKLLNKWHIQDPVSAKEIARNNVIYSQPVQDGATTKIQGNRNPFVDHPEYVAAIWGPSCLSVLPVTITNLSVKKVSNTAVISWKVSNEQSISKYEIERSINGIAFEKIAAVNSNGSSTYFYTNNNLPKTQRIYYRIRAIELSGKTSLTNIVSVDGNTNSSAIKVYPNPAVEYITAEVNNAGINEVNLITIMDATGKVVLQRSIAINQSILRIPVLQLANGVYTLKVANTSTTSNSKFVIAK